MRYQAQRGKEQVTLSHMKIFKSLTTPSLAHLFSICSMTWHQDSNPYMYGRTGVLDSRYPKNETQASRQNRKFVEVEGPLDWHLISIWEPSAWHLCLGYTYSLATGPQLIKKKGFHADQSFHRTHDQQTAGSPHFPTPNHWRLSPKLFFPSWYPCVSLEGLLKISEYHLRLL